MVTAIKVYNPRSVFSRAERKESKRLIKNLAEKMPSFPYDKYRAGMNDTIIIKDQYGDEYEHEIIFPPSRLPEVFQQFIGKHKGDRITFKGEKYTLFNIIKG